MNDIYIYVSQNYHLFNVAAKSVESHIYFRLILYYNS